MYILRVLGRQTFVAVHHLLVVQWFHQVLFITSKHDLFRMLFLCAPHIKSKVNQDVN